MKELKREYVCANCGLIWLDKRLGLRQGVICPECSNDGHKFGENNVLIATDTMTWFYAVKATEEMLNKRGKKIHYHKAHPWFEE